MENSIYYKNLYVIAASLLRDNGIDTILMFAS
jgi:hypothetical protein